MQEEKAVFAAGCFWGVEESFRKLHGVTATRVGYTGGHHDNTTYKDVCSGRTGHAEAVEVTYNPKEIEYDELLSIFWKIHDPTTLNRQGPDVGSQYRSAIFYLTPEQKRKAEESKRRMNETRKFRRPIVTEITAASEFWEAEEYHQKYLSKNKRGSCKTHIWF